MTNHGLSHSRFYRSYISIKSRCNNKNNKDYNHYGGRGIKCLRNSFIDFKNDMYDSYMEHVKQYGKKNTTIDRIDNNGNYCKQNCKRSTIKEQANNRRPRIRKPMIISELCNKYNMKRGTIYNYRWKYGENFIEYLDKSIGCNHNK